MRIVYAALGSTTPILEVAVYTGFKTLDTISHVSAAAGIADALLKAFHFVLIPSVISVHSWNVIFSPEMAWDRYDSVVQERFALDPRLHPPRQPAA